MSKSKDVSIQIGPGFLGCLTLIFVYLKLTAVIDWSWWWVTAPLWGMVALSLAVLAIGAIVLGILSVIAWLVTKSR